MLQYSERDSMFADQVFNFPSQIYLMLCVLNASEIWFSKQIVVDFSLSR